MTVRWMLERLGKGLSATLLGAALTSTMLVADGCTDATEAGPDAGPEDAGAPDSSPPSSDSGPDAQHPSDASPDGASGDAGADGDAGDAGAQRQFDHNVVFVTSSTYVPGDLGGIPAADQLCTNIANDHGFEGEFIAWLSDSLYDSKERLGDARGWVRPDGKPVMNFPSNFAETRPFYYPIRLDETEADVGNVEVATNTNAVGAVTMGGCGNFTSTTGELAVGVSEGTTARYTFHDHEAYGDCGDPYHLYCFGISKTEPLTIEPDSGRTAFVSSVWVPGGGLDSADAHCQQEADAETGLTGTFKALLATSTASAASRFDATGDVWIRTDGIALASSAAALMDGEFDTSINVTADGDGYVGSAGVWTGAPSPTDLGSEATTCQDWATDETTASGTGTQAASSAPRAFSEAAGSTSCDTGLRLYCLQE